MRLTWESAGTDEPGDQNADSRLGDHAYWSLGPAGAGKWSAELIVRDEHLEEMPNAGVQLFSYVSEQDAKIAAQRWEDGEAQP